jgi:hypothetical protein
VARGTALTRPLRHCRNALVPRFFSRFPEPLAEGVDALASDVVRGARLRGDVLGAHQPALERHAVQGHYPAFGRSRDPELDVAAQLRRWLELAGLAVHPSSARKGTAADRARMPPPAVHSAEVERLDPLGGHASGWRFFALPRNLGASRTRPRSRPAWTRRVCICRAATAPRFRRRRTCGSRFPLASPRRCRPLACDRWKGKLGCDVLPVLLV